MQVLLPGLVCVVAIVVALLPPANVEPVAVERGAGRRGLVALAIATAAVVSVIAFAMHQLASADRGAPRTRAGEVAGNP